MPMSALRYCMEPTCREKVQDRPRCEEHSKALERIKNKRDYEKKKQKRKFYKTAIWQDLRIQQLTKTPHCEWQYDTGTNCGKVATIVDHIVPREDGGPDHLDNFQSLCHSHHSKKTAIQTNFGRTSTGVKEGEGGSWPRKFG